MSTPVNYYLGLSRGQSNNPGNVTIGTSSAGSAVDVELRLQINNGTNATGLTIMDAKRHLETFIAYIVQRGITPGSNLGTDLPAN